MSKERDTSSPVPMLQEKDHRNNQSTNKRYKPKFNLLVIPVIFLIALILIVSFAGII